MKILFIGDVVGEPGRLALEKHLPLLRNSLQPDCVIVNGENTAHGIGITPQIADWMIKDLNIDCITGGNHSYDKREIIPYMPSQPKLIRPHNFPQGSAGNGVYSFKTYKGQYVTVINAMARLFVDYFIDCPFRAVDEILKNTGLKKGSDAIIIDFHGEATSEKLAFGNYFDGRVSAVLGTHTHIPTADYQILPQGTAYQTDVGMTGCYNSIIGMDKIAPIQGFLMGRRDSRLEPAVGEGTLCGAFVETDDITGLAKMIKPIRVGGQELSQAS